MYGYGSSQSNRWLQIPLQTAFSYSGANNLLVSVYSQNTVTEAGYSQYYYTSTGSYMFITGSSSTNPPPVSMSLYRPNIQIVKGAWQRGAPSGVGPPSDHTRGAGTLAWGTIINGNYPNSASATLTTSFIYLPTGTKPVLSFWQYYDTESGVDGGRVLYSIDSAGGFSVLSPIGGYPATCTALGGVACFSGPSAGWRRAVFDISTLTGNTIRFQFQFASDAANQYPGWYIDDIKVGYPVQIDEVWSYGTGTTGEKIVLYNYATFSVDISSWRVISFNYGTFTIGLSQTINGWSTYTINSGAGEDRYGDAGDYVLLRNNSGVRAITGSSYSSATRMDVDYMQYGSPPSTPQLWCTLWTQSSALPAPGSSSQYLKRETDNGFVSVDTGDAADWGLIPELSFSGIWLMAPVTIPPLAFVLARKKKR
jgi:hypothetical protein